MIKIFSDARYKIDKKAIRQTTKSYLEAAGISENESVNLIFVGTRKMREIAAAYKKENQALPVLSFSYKDDPVLDDGMRMIGEIFICYPQAVLLASVRERRVNDVILSLIEHGIENLLK